MRLVSQDMNKQTGWPLLILGQNTVLGSEIPKL